MAGRAGMSPTVRANNAFAIALYRRLQRRPGNLLISPACLSAGLVLLHTGARGETARQISRVLHLPESGAGAAGSRAAFMNDLNAHSADDSYEIRSAAGIWMQTGYPVLNAFRASLKDMFAIDVAPVDFFGNPIQACDVINTWTETCTHGKIRGMLQPADLPPRTRLVLTSALYMRASWRDRFRREHTRREPFHVSPRVTVEVPMMNTTSYLIIQRYYDGGSFQGLRMPCGSDGELAMTVLLPRNRDGLAELEASLTAEALEAWWPRFRKPEEIIVALPKFRIRANLMLNGPLSELGMRSAFEGDADFSGINGKTRDLFLSAVRQSTYLDVQEEGIEAAAAIDAISPDAFGEEPPVFRADHPFLFLVTDTRTGCILFLGRVVNPLQQNYDSPEIN
jgi:serpin B